MHINKQFYVHSQTAEKGTRTSFPGYLLLSALVGLSDRRTFSSSNPHPVLKLTVPVTLLVDIDAPVSVCSTLTIISE